LNQDKKFVPIDFGSHGRSVESSAQACRDRCSRTSGCVGSSFWSNGGCHLAGFGATLQNWNGVQSYSCSSSDSNSGESLIVESSYAGVSKKQFDRRKDKFAASMAKTLGVDASKVTAGSITSSVRRFLNTGVTVEWEVDENDLSPEKVKIVTDIATSPKFGEMLKENTQLTTGLAIAGVATIVTPKYVMSKNGKTTCMDGYKYISNEKQCNKARKRLGKKYNGKKWKNNSNRLPFCWIGAGGYANFNKAGTTGSTSGNSKLLCKRIKKLKSGSARTGHKQSKKDSEAQVEVGDESNIMIDSAEESIAFSISEETWNSIKYFSMIAFILGGTGFAFGYFTKKYDAREEYEALVQMQEAI